MIFTPKVRHFWRCIFYGKKRPSIKKYSPEFKLNVILNMREYHLEYNETSRKYNINSHSRIAKWERKYLEEGFEGLVKDNLERPSITSKKRGRPPKPDKQVEEDLIAENQRLRMETKELVVIKFSCLNKILSFASCSDVTRL